MSNDTRQPLSLPQLQSSLSSLATAAHVLDGFAHRNKNQHRATKWWGPFDMLRRSLHKTLPDLEAAVQRAEVLFPSPHAAAGAKRKRTAGGGGAGGGGGGAARQQVKQPELDRVAERATWTRDVVGCRAYEAFTQLAADKQFAQLGLTLIGVLAQVEAAIAPLAREDAPAPDAAAAAMVSPAAARAAAARGGAEGGGPDLGVAVSRAELESGDGVGCGGDDDQDVDEVRPSVGRAPSPAPRLPSAEERQHAPEKRKTPRKKEVEGALPRMRMEAESQKRPAEPKEAKKVKKKKKGGDEFDDLFSSLL